jgi:hypothetical protein
MTLHQLSAAPSATQIKALLRGLPARALHECAVLVGLSPSRLARMLRCTRQPRGRYRLYPSEKLLRLAVLRREFDRVFGEHAIAKMQAPVPSFGGASALELAVTETGFRVVREFLAGDDDVMRASAAQAGVRLDAEEARALRLANRLPADRVLRVAQLVLRSQGRGRLPVAELNTLVARLAAAPSRASGDAIRQQIIDGFYGPMKKRRVREMVST